VGGVALGKVVGPGGAGGVEAQGAKLNGVGAEVTVELVQGSHRAISQIRTRFYVEIGRNVASSSYFYSHRNARGTITLVRILDDLENQVDVMFLSVSGLLKESTT
jgi:hypothetical protein